MQYQQAEVRVGLIIVLAFVLMLVMLFFAGDLAEKFKSRREVRMMFHSAKGLNTEADVRLSGAKVGWVEDIQVQGSQVTVIAQIDAAMAIKKDAQAMIKTSGPLGGAKYIEINPGTSEFELSFADTLFGQEEPGFDQILTSVVAITEKIKLVLDDVHFLIAGSQKQGPVVTTLYQTQRLLEDMSTVLHSTNQLMADKEQGLPAVLGEVAGISHQVGSLLRDNRTNLDGTLSHIKTTTGQLPQLLARLEEVLVTVKTINTMIAQGDGTVGGLFKDKALERRLQHTLDSADSLLIQFREKGVRINVDLF